MAKVEKEVKFEKKHYLTNEDLSKLQELIVYYHKNASATVSTCIHIAYEKMKSDKKETVLDEVMKALGELNNEVLKLKTQVKEENKLLYDKLQRRATQDQVRKITEYLNAQKLLMGTLEV